MIHCPIIGREHFQSCSAVPAGPLPGCLGRSFLLQLSQIAQINNMGKSDVTLVMPGDKSACHWRTPIIGWSFLSLDSKDQHSEKPPLSGGLRRGNNDPLTLDEVFTLEPGDKIELNNWLALPHPLSPGNYGVVFYN